MSSAREAEVDTGSTHEGACTCGAVRYRLASGPLFVHACHCRWCQRETGSAFALNALIESGALSLRGLITHRSPATAAVGAYDTAFGDPACLKMILDWSAA